MVVHQNYCKFWKAISKKGSAYFGARPGKRPTVETGEYSVSSLTLPLIMAASIITLDANGHHICLQVKQGGNRPDFQGILGGESMTCYSA
jgi:hypothetical protein